MQLAPASLGISSIDPTMRIVSVKKCEKKYLFHGSSKHFDVLDPAYCRIVEEYGRPFVLASDTISNKFCYTKVPAFQQATHDHGWAYHRINHQNRQLLLGAHLDGWLYVLPGDQFYEVVREDYEDGVWDQGIEYIAFEQVTPLEIVRVQTAWDCEMIEAYEFLGKEYVGTFSLERFTEICLQGGKSDLLASVQAHFAKPFVPQMPSALTVYKPLVLITNETFGVSRQTIPLKVRSSARAVIINDRQEICLMHSSVADF